MIPLLPLLSATVGCPSDDDEARGCASVPGQPGGPWWLLIAALAKVRLRH